jgi:uncharacterized tellurite resistance protein B-like protein
MFKINITLIILLLVLFLAFFLQRSKVSSIKKGSLPELLEIKALQEAKAEPQQPSSPSETEKRLLFPSTLAPLKKAEALEESCESEEAENSKYPFTSKILKILKERQKEKNFLLFMQNHPYKKGNLEERFFYDIAVSAPPAVYTILTAEEEMKTLDPDGKILIRETIYALNHEYHKLFEDLKSQLIPKSEITLESDKIISQYTLHLIRNLKRSQRKELVEKFALDSKKENDAL